jgi:CheY-like chemotaxis protein
MDFKDSATVLIVDDDPGLLKILAEQVSLFGYQPIMASSGEKALEIVPRHPGIDLLLTDVMMPSMNGIELARKVVELYPEIKILFMSGYICPSLSGYGVQDNDPFFLQKPFTPNTLISKMRNVLAASHLAPIK